MIPERSTAGPHIPTTATGQLRAELRSLVRRDPQIEELVETIRNGDDRPLLGLVRRTQLGDQDSAVVAIAALLPRLCKVVIHRLPIVLWKPAIDDYVTTAYLVLLDVDTDAGHEFLADKIIARTRRRHERQLYARRPTPTPLDDLVDAGPVADDIEARALARMRLAAVADAVRTGKLAPRRWQAIVTVGLDPRIGPAHARDRRSASRARRSLELLCGDAEAA